MIDKTILQKIGIDENSIKETVNEIDKKNVFTISLKEECKVCPKCQLKNIRKKDIKTRTIKCKIFDDSHTTIKLVYRRYRCNNCKAVFNENISFVEKRQRVSKQTIQSILKFLIEPGVTYEHAARHYGLSVTEIQDIFDKNVNYERKKLPEVFCIDECHNKRQFDKNYCVILTNPFNSDPIDIFQDRTLPSLKNYFSKISLNERLNVQYVSMDMWEPYKETIKEFFPNAIIGIDPFHVISNIVRAVKKIELGVLATLGDKPFQRGILKKYFDYFIGFKKNHQKKLEDPFYKSKLSREKVSNIILSINATLTAAIKLLQSYRLINKICSKRNFEIMFNKLIKSNPIYNMPCFLSVKTMFNNWFQEISNSFICFGGKRITNGPAEGFNSKYKKLMRNANGVKNFKRFRNRLIHCEKHKKCKSQKL